MFPFLLYGPATCKYPEKTINVVNGPSGYSRSANSDVSREATGWTRGVHPIPLHCCARLYLCERATDASGERIHPSPGPRRSREKSQITGCGRFTGTIEMWVMQPKEQKFVYTRKEAVRWIERGGAFIRMTSFNRRPEWTTKFGVIASIDIMRHRRRHIWSNCSFALTIFIFYFVTYLSVLVF